MTREKNLKNIKCVLLDMDGTIYLGDTVFPGTKPFLNMLEDRGVQYLFLTNNSSRSTETYIQKLNRMNISAERHHMLTSAHAAAAYINRHHKDKKVYILGMPALIEEMQTMGIRYEPEDPEVVLMGFDLELNYKKLTELCNFVRKGLPYISTHPDINLPVESGIIPDVGCNIAFVQASTGRVPDVIPGKPSEQILAAAEAQTGVSRENMLMVGDRLYTDIAMGRFGVRTALLLSGETAGEDVPASKDQPDFIFKDITELHKALEAS